MAPMAVAGQSDLLAKVDYIHDAMKRSKAHDQTVKVAISSASDANRRLVQRISDVHIVHSMPPVSKRQCCQQQLSPHASIQKFEWTGDEDSPQELHRLKLRLQDLIGRDGFPSDMKFRDIHTEALFNVRLENESHRVEISGEHQPCVMSPFHLAEGRPMETCNRPHC